MSDVLFQFEHLGQVHRLDLEAALAYFVDDAIANPFADDRRELIAALVAGLGDSRAEIARSGVRVDPLGRERIAARVPSLVALADLQPSEHIAISAFDALSEPVPYAASLAPAGAAPASLQASAGAQRSHHVAVLNDARHCVGHYGQAVFDHDERHIDGICRADGLLLAAAGAARMPPLRAFDGSLVSLCSLWGNGYFHWLLEVLPKLLLIERAGHRLADIDLFMVRQKIPALMAFLAYLGIPDTKVFEWHIAPHLRVKRLIVASTLEHYDFSVDPNGIAIEPWVSRLMRERFSVPRAPGTRGRRIYIDREHAAIRKVINNAEVKAALAEHEVEFHALETLSLEQKQELFASADAIIGPAGAGFANLVFAHPGTQVLIFYQQGFETNSFWSLSNNNGLAHYHLVAEPSSRYFPSEHTGTINENFLIDVGALRHTLEFMFARKQ